MFRNAIILTSLVALTLAAGCAAPTSREQSDEAVESVSQDLTHESLKASVNKAFAFFEGPKASLTVEMRSATLPRGVRTEVAKARTRVFSQMSADHSLTSNDADMMNVYAVYTNAAKTTLAGYALWVHANNGSVGAAYLVAFDTKGAKVVDKNDWYQEDGD